jgi:hypothetical protein
LAAECFQISANDSVRRSPQAMNSQHSGRRRSDSGTPWLTLSEQKMHGKIKGCGTVAASSRCLHKVFSGTPFFPNGTLGRQLIEQTRITACHLLPSTPKYDREFAPRGVGLCTARLQGAGNWLPRPCSRKSRGTRAATAMHLPSFDLSLAERSAAYAAANTRRIPSNRDNRPTFSQQAGR